MSESSGSNLRVFGGRWVARSSALLFAVTVAVSMLGFAQGVAISRILGPAGKGEVFLAILTATSVAQVLECSLGAGLQYHVARGEARVRRGVGLALVFAAGGALVSLVTVVALAALFPHAVPDVLGVGGLLAAAAIVPAEMLNLSLGPLFLAADRVRAGAAVEVGRAALVLVLVVVLVGFGSGGSTAAVASVAAGFGIGALAAVLVLAVAHPRDGGGKSEAGTWQIVWFGARQHLGSVLARVTKRADSWVLLLLSGSTAVGVYSVASGLAELPMMLPRSLRGTAATFTAARDPRQAGVGAAQLSRVSLAATAALNAVYSCVGFALLPLVYGDEFAGARWPFVILLLSTTALGGYVVVGGYLSGAGRPLMLTMILLPPASANVALSFVLIPTFGLPGNAWASTVTSVAVLGISLVVFGWVSGRPAGEALVPRRGDLARAHELIART